MADKERLVEQFKQTTGETSERAQFFLDASQWNLESAVDYYYKDGGMDEEMPEEEQWPPAGPQSSRGFATLGDYHQPEQASKDDDSQTFFAGGSEHSGQLISGPPRDKKPNELAQAVFDAAKKHGAVPVEEETKKQAEQAKKNKSKFVGAGYKLGQNEGPSEMVGKPRSPTAEDAPERRRIIKFWSNGFSIDNGPLRDGQAAQDKVFLESVSKGMVRDMVLPNLPREIPVELRPAVKGSEVHVEIEDHRQEPFSPPKKTMVAFAGEGYKLGNIAPQVISSPKQQSSSSTAGIGSGSEAAKPVELPLDPSQPTTQLQIRLANGGRLVGKFNHGHTVGDIRSFINQSQPGGSHTYRLLTTFPNKELTDDSVTLSEAKLINAVIVQRMK